MNEKLTSILFFAVICLIGITLAIAQPVPTGTTNETHNITIATPVQDTARIDTSSDSCRNSTTPIIISGYVTHINDDPVSNLTVTITNLNTSESFTARTANNQSYYQVRTSSTHIRACDILRFNASEGGKYCLSDYNVTAEDIESGRFMQSFVGFKPDLIITKKSESLDNSETFTVFYRVENLGDANANESNTTIYVDGVLKMKDPVSRLAPGEYHENTVGAFHRAYDRRTTTVMVCADGDDTLKEGIMENNNCMENELIYDGPLPNLYFFKDSHSVSTPDSKGRFYIDYYVVNHPVEENPDKWRCCACPTNTTLSITNVLVNDSTSDIIDEDHVCELCSYGAHEATLGPFTCSPGKEVVVNLCLDGDNDVLEGDEDDNVFTKTFLCPAAKPDLVITNCSAEWINQMNATLAILYTVANIGNGAANASTTRILTYDDPVPALAPGESYTNTVSPLNGSGTINFYADWYDDVGESDEDNNCRPCNIGAGGVPDLTLYMHPIKWIDGINKTYNVHYCLINDVGVNTTNKTKAYFYIDGNLSAIDHESLVGIPPSRWNCNCRRYGPFTMSGTNDTVKICVEWEGGRICKEQLFKWGGCLANDGTLFVCNDVIDRDCTFVADLDCRRCITDRKSVV